MIGRLAQLITSLLFFGLVFVSLVRSMPYGWTASRHSDAVELALEPGGSDSVLHLDVVVSPDVRAEAVAASVSVTTDLALSAPCSGPLDPAPVVLTSLRSAALGGTGSEDRSAFEDAQVRAELWQELDLDECEADGPCTVPMTVHLRLQAQGEQRLPSCLRARGVATASVRVLGEEVESMPKMSLSSLAVSLSASDS